MYEKYLDINPEVKEALEKKQSVVALESTIISHGMPYPANVETALNVCEIVRANGAVPATIGIVKGKLKVGMTEEEIEYFAQAKDILKISRKDIPFAVSEKKNGATTVAGTMIIANMAGIKIFVTGGIGGVHKGASESFDISADLMELASTDVVVVCAGAKSILDIGATLEYLETKGVPVLGYQTDEFPAFYTRKSGFKIDYDMRTVEDVASFVKAKQELNLKGGVVLGCPIPEENELDPQMIEKVIDEAIIKSKEQGITGKAVTPFLLNEIKEITKGDSLAANIQLVFNNAQIGARLAYQLQKLR